MVRNLRIFTLTLLVICLAGLCGCASLGTYNPATGRNEFIFIPTDTEVDMGREMHSKILAEYPLSGDHAQVSRLQRIGKKVAQVSDRQDYEYQFFLVKADDLNAFTVPGGKIYVFSKLAEGFRTDDELAAVLAHEIGHCSARHAIKKIQAAMGYDLVASFIFNQVNMTGFVKEVASMSSNTVTGLVFSAYSRQDEHEADLLGLKYMRLAGYDVQGMLRVLEFLEKQSKDPKIPLILRTHPYVSDRIIQVRKDIEHQSVNQQKGTAGLTLIPATPASK